MNERSRIVAGIAAEVLPLACFAASAIFFAYSAENHKSSAEQATSEVVRHNEEQLGENDLIAVLVFEGLVAAQGINIARRKS